MSDERFSIGDLARATDTTVGTIRYYERAALLGAPSRTPGNYRSYERRHLERLSFIRRARELGFSMDRVAALLGLADDEGRSCEAVDEIAREHLVEVARKITDLEALRRELTSLLGQCRRGTIAECKIVEALAPEPTAVRVRARRRDGSSTMP